MSSGSSDATTQGHRSLAESINSATRPLHSQLNKRIVAHLPQALPPRAADPSAYVTGLLHIAPIYAKFESMWHDILTHAPHCKDDKNSWRFDGAVRANRVHREDSKIPTARKDESGSGSGAVLAEPFPHVCDRMHYILGALHLPGLLRDSRIRKDIEAMTGWSKDTVDQKIADVESRGPLGSFLEHIKKAIHDGPHVLIAYSYILYMALFSGGRFMRASLESAGEEFWLQVPSPLRPNMLRCEMGHPEATDAYPQNDIARPSLQHPNPHNSLHFFNFPMSEDGEDLKREFKERLLAVECRLDPPEFSDVVEEGIKIFEHMLMVVEQLDHVCNPTPSTSDSEGRVGIQMLRPENLLQLGKLRDSVVVARERNAKKSREQLRNSLAKSGSEMEDGKEQKGNGAAAVVATEGDDGGEKTIRFEFSVVDKMTGKEQTPTCYDGAPEPRDSDPPRPRGFPRMIPDLESKIPPRLDPGMAGFDPKHETRVTTGNPKRTTVSAGFNSTNWFGVLVPLGSWAVFLAILMAIFWAEALVGRKVWWMVGA